MAGQKGRSGGKPISDAELKLRRDMVRKYWLMGYTSRSIAEALKTQENIVNPNTGEAYVFTTIANDIKLMKEEYAEARIEEIGNMRAIQFAKLERLEEKAWQTLEKNKGAWLKDQAAALNTIREILKDMRSVYGLDAPNKQQIMGADEGPVEIIISYSDEAGKL